MCRLILGLLLAILLMLTAFASAQENTSTSDASAQASLDGGGTMPAETTGSQESTYGA